MHIKSLDYTQASNAYSRNKLFIEQGINIMSATLLSAFAKEQDLLYLHIQSIEDLDRAEREGWNVRDFGEGNVVIDFRGYNHSELTLLRKACKLVNPDKNAPAYTFYPAYYCRGGRWFAGAEHQLVGRPSCRVGDLVGLE